MITIITKKGGYIGTNAFPTLVSRIKQQPALNEVIDHIDYISQLIGINYITLSLYYYAGQWLYVSDEAAVIN